MMGNEIELNCYDLVFCIVVCANIVCDSRLQNVCWEGYSKNLCVLALFVTVLFVPIMFVRILFVPFLLVSTLAVPVLLV